MKNVLVAVGVCLVSAINAAAQWTAPTTTSGTTPIHYDGNVGIGTGGATPATILDIRGTGMLNGKLTNTQADGSTSWMVQNDSGCGTCAAEFGIRGSSRTAYGALVASDRYLYANGPITFMADTAYGILKFAAGGNSERMRIASNGFMGIGTNNPQSLLHLSGGANNGAAITFDPPGSTQLFRLQTLQGVPNWGGLTMNSNFNGTGWTLDDTGQNGWFLKLDGRGTGTATAGITNGFWLYRIPSGLPNGQNLHVGDEYPTFGATNGFTYVRDKLGVGTAPNNIPDSALQVVGSAHISGDVTVDGNINAKYQDVAEWVPVAEEMPAGTVVVVSGTMKNTVGPSLHAYDTRVAGVVSAKPGLTLGEASSTKAKIATTGRVKVRVDATSHPIAMGDLLVTSDKSGAAMFSEPLDLGGVKIHRPGTLIGKALEPLPNGQGEILVLLSLQ